MQSNDSDNPSYRWVILGITWVIYFVFGNILVCIAPLVTPIRSELSLSDTQVGFILGTVLLIYVFTAYPMGLLIDRIGSKKAISIALFLSFVSMFVRSFAFDFYSLLGGVIIFGFGGPIISVGLPKLLDPWFSSKDRGIASGIYISGSAAGAAFILALTNSVIIPLVGTWRNCFMLLGVAAIVALGLLLFLGKETPHSFKLDNKKTVDERVSFTETITRLLKHRNIKIILFTGTTFFLGTHGLNNWLPQIFESKGMTPEVAGSLASSVCIFSIFGALIIPKVSDLIGSRKNVMILMSLGCGSSLFLIEVTSLPFAWIGLIVAGICFGGMLPISILMLMESPEIKKKYLGGAIGIFFSVGEIGGFVGPFLMGFLKDLTNSFFIGMLILAVVMMSAAVFMMMHYRERKLVKP